MQGFLDSSAITEVTVSQQASYLTSLEEELNLLTQPPSTLGRPEMIYLKVVCKLQSDA